MTELTDKDIKSYYNYILFIQKGGETLVHVKTWKT